MERPSLRGGMPESAVGQETIRLRRAPGGLAETGVTPPAADNHPTAAGV